ncbi:MAG: hypothetical protein AAB805_00650 [Patescibacteria group bacterium]
MARGMGHVQKKILLLLLGGLALGLSGSPNRYFYILRTMKKAWKEIDEEKLRRSIRSLYQAKMVSEKSNLDGTVTITLTEKGKRRALTYDIENMSIPRPKKWDGKWRVVLFDIPEKYKKTRDLFRIHIRSLGFYEFQKSVFVHPFECIDEIEYLVKFHNIGSHVRFILAEAIDDETSLKHHFGLTRK